MKHTEYRFYFDGMVVDVKLSFHRLCSGRIANGEGGFRPVASLTEGINNGECVKPFQKRASCFLRTAISKRLLDVIGLKSLWR